mmetsp:Transcript_1267/g.2318  ORF Transcript_1267/g.2318 Transcript_1267/m.2318 type:complete len:206 (+) Transcript_1267:681-1298(+)
MAVEFVAGRRSERLDARSLQALGALLHFEFDLGAFGQRAEAAAVLDFAVVGEQVLAAVGRRDEAESLAVVEPLDDAGLHGAHERFPWCCWMRFRPQPERLRQNTTLKIRHSGRRRQLPAEAADCRGSDRQQRRYRSGHAPGARRTALDTALLEDRAGAFAAGPTGCRHAQFVLQGLEARATARSGHGNVAIGDAVADTDNHGHEV